MKQSGLLKAISLLTPYQKTKLNMFILDALHLNEEDKNIKLCPYCHKNSRIIEKALNGENKDFNVKNVTVSLLMILIPLPCTQKSSAVFSNKSY